MKRFFIPILSFILFISGTIVIAESITFVSDTQKQVIRDTKRLNDLTVLRTAIENYKIKNGFYPKLDSGTNIKGYVNSVWDSQWKSFCSTVGVSNCPSDPVNEILNCDCSIFSADGQCIENNINVNIDKATCYNPKTESFACTNGSRIYQYQVLNNGRNYSLTMDFEYADSVDWSVSSTSSGDLINVKNGCVSGNNFYKVMSNKVAKCGDGVLSFGEECESNSKKLEFCNTTDGKKGVRYVPCSSSCLWDFSNVGSCVNTGFCGDGIKDSNEECDGGYQKMCYDYQSYVNKNASDQYANDSHHNWYKENIRYCATNCKWNTEYLDSTSYCGGFCGDNIIQRDMGEECDDTSNPHCSSENCRFKNSAPKVLFDFFGNRNSKTSYIKSSVWSGGNLQYQDKYFDSNNVDLIIADKQGSDYVAVWNSDFIEIKVDASDVDGDSLFYKYKFDQTYNVGIKIKYKNSSNNFVDYSADTYVSSNIIRIYPTSIASGENTKNASGSFVFGSSYIGFYDLNVTVSDLYNYGVGSQTNIINAINSYSIKFKIGPGCGDGLLSKDLGEGCELKPGEIQNNIFTNWSASKPSNNSSLYCAISSFSDSGKWSDVLCANSYYGLCERRSAFGCDNGWVNGQNDNCYMFTSSSKNWQNAELECESYNGKLVVMDDVLESNFLKASTYVSSKSVFWVGYKFEGGYWSGYYDGKWTPSLMYKNSFRTKFYGTGVGFDSSNQYSCGLPWGNNACNAASGYCGDGVMNTMFEQCDYSDKSSYGKGSSSSSPYECGPEKWTCSTTLQANYFRNKTYSCDYSLETSENPDQLSCRLSGGYCGDSYLETKYEHCDPKDRITSAVSSSNTYGINSASRQYICKSVNDYSDYRSDPYNNIDDYVATKNDNVDRACRKSTGGYCGDGTVQMFYSLDANSNYTIVSSDKNLQSDNDWKKILYDANSSKHYFLNGSIKTYFTATQENMLVEECDPSGFIAPVPASSSPINQYGVCGINNGSTDVCVRSFDGNGNISSYSGNCACRKISGGYCGDNYLQNTYGESCDSGASLLGLTNLNNQFCTSCMKMDCSSGLNMSSSSVYLIRNNVTVSVYTGALAIMNALSAGIDGDSVYVGGSSFDFDSNYSIDLNGRDIVLNSCVATVWNWK